MTFSHALGQITGLREDPIPPFSGTGGAIGLTSLVQMILALIIVLFLVKWLVPKYLAKLPVKGSTKLGADLQIEEAANVQGGRILLVKARGKSLLIGAGQSGLTFLADLTDETDYLHVPVAEPADGDKETDFGNVLERLRKLQS